MFCVKFNKKKPYPNHHVLLIFKFFYNKFSSKLVILFSEKNLIKKNILICGDDDVGLMLDEVRMMLEHVLCLEFIIILFFGVLCLVLIPMFIQVGPYGNVER